MADVWLACLLASAVTCLLVVIEVTRAAHAEFSPVWRGSVLVYLLMAMLGNVITTVIASATLAKGLPPAVPAWFWDTVIGVFGFEAVLKNVNITFAGVGVLSVNDWIVKARDSATADVIEEQVRRDERRAKALAERLKDLDETDLNAHVLAALGDGRVELLDAEAAKAGANRRLIKALALAKADYRAAQAILGA